MGESVNKRISTKPSLSGALEEKLPYVVLCDGGVAVTFCKGHTNTSSPHNLLRVELPLANRAGPQLMWPY